jgi:hypothetical protein
MEEEDRLTTPGLDNLWVPTLEAVDTVLEATVAAAKVDHHHTQWVPILEAVDKDLEVAVAGAMVDHHLIRWSIIPPTSHPNHSRNWTSRPMINSRMYPYLMNGTRTP